MQYFNRFGYGYDVSAYYDRAIQILRKTYYWVTEEHLNPEWRFEIRKVKFDDYQYFQLHRQEDGTFVAEEMKVCYNGDEFIRRILEVNEQYVLDAIPVADVYEVPFYPLKLSTGWELERYEFHLLETGDYSVEIRVTNRMGGLKKSVFIPPRYFETESYEAFIEAYQMLVPSGIYQIPNEELLSDGQLKAFLGFGNRRPHPEVQIVKKPMFVVFGVDFAMQGTKKTRIRESILEESPDSIEDVWDDVIQAMRQVKDTVLGYWGIMCRKDSNDNFEPWTAGYKTGRYFAGIEFSNVTAVPEEWACHIIPESTFVVAETTADMYDEIFLATMNGVIPELGYRLDGSVCERIDPRSDKISLYFPVKQLVNQE